MRMIAGAVACLLAVGAARPAAAQGPPSQPALPNQGISPPRAVGGYSNPANDATTPFDVNRAEDHGGASSDERTGPLDPEERAALARGEYTVGERVGGAFAAGLLGFGSGQAIQGRWEEGGWIFSVGEPAALTVGIVGLAMCPDEGCSGLGQVMAVSGFVGFAGLRLWGFFDSILVPNAHNKRLPRLRARAGIPEYARGLTPFVVPAARGEGATVGLTLRF